VANAQVAAAAAHVNAQASVAANAALARKAARSTAHRNLSATAAQAATASQPANTQAPTQDQITSELLSSVPKPKPYEPKANQAPAAALELIGKETAKLKAQGGILGFLGNIIGLFANLVVRFLPQIQGVMDAVKGISSAFGSGNDAETAKMSSIEDEDSAATASELQSQLESQEQAEQETAIERPAVNPALVQQLRAVQSSFDAKESNDAQELTPRLVAASRELDQMDATARNRSQTYLPRRPEPSLDRSHMAPAASLAATASSQRRYSPAFEAGRAKGRLRFSQAAVASPASLSFNCPDFVDPDSISARGRTPTTLGV
jgi:hypothetical protein